MRKRERERKGSSPSPGETMRLAATRRLLMRLVCFAKIHEKLVFLSAFKRFKDTQRPKSGPKQTEKSLTCWARRHQRQRVALTSVFLLPYILCLKLLAVKIENYLCFAAAESWDNNCTVKITIRVFLLTLCRGNSVKVRVGYANSNEGGLRGVCRSPL